MPLNLLAQTGEEQKPEAKAEPKPPEVKKRPLLLSKRGERTDPCRRMHLHIMYIIYNIMYTYMKGHVFFFHLVCLFFNIVSFFQPRVSSFQPWLSVLEPIIFFSTFVSLFQPWPSLFQPWASLFQPCLLLFPTDPFQPLSVAREVFFSTGDVFFSTLVVSFSTLAVSFSTLGVSFSTLFALFSTDPLDQPPL